MKHRLPSNVKEIDKLLAKRPTQRIDYFDRAYKGLSLRVGPNTATWYFFKRVDGKLYRIAIGEYGDGKGGTVTLATARRKLDELAAAVAEGKHPKSEVARARAERQAARKQDSERILAELAPRWLKVHKKPTKKRNRDLADSVLRDYDRHVRKLVAKFGERDVATIKRSELIRYLEDVKAESESEANRAWTVARRLFAYGRDLFDLESNPAADIEKPAAQAIRKRVLKRDEIRTLWRACEIAGYPYGHALRFALCTGQRIGEVGALRRSDLEPNGSWWVQTENKSKRRTDVFLGPLARAIVADCPNFGAASYVFSATGGEGPLRSDIWKYAMRRHVSPALAQAVSEGLPKITAAFTRHDLRRTVSTGLREWCLADHDAVERVLNHAVSGLRAHYDLATHRPRIEVTLKRWDQELQAILNPAPAGNAGSVTSLQDQRRKRARSA